MANSRICSITDCGKKFYARGWCYAHYLRWRRHGDPLAGGTSNGAAKRFFENVVLSFRGDECLTWPFAVTDGGYGRLEYAGKHHIVSRLVCEMVQGPPPGDGYDAAHSCGNGHLACVNQSHVSWKNRTENMAEANVRRGEASPLTGLTLEQVREIIGLRGTATQKEIGERFGISRSAVSKIMLGTRWASSLSGPSKPSR